MLFIRIMPLSISISMESLASNLPPPMPNHRPLPLAITSSSDPM